MSAAGGTLLLLGARRGALGAARRLGLRVLLLAERGGAPPEAAAAARCVEVPPDARERLRARAALALCEGERVDAVFAATERNVPAAALARAALGLEGADAELARRCTDKRAMKDAIAAADLPCAAWLPAARHTPLRLVERLGLPVVLKPPRSSGSRGLRLARSLSELEALPRARKMAEAFLDGEEMSVESFVHDGRVVFANPTRYMVRLHANVLPAPPDAARWAAALELNARALAALGVRRGLTHLELFLTAEGPVFGELALRPPGGRLMRLLKRAWGFDAWELALRLELGEAPPALPERPRRCAGTWILHPGEGRVGRALDVAAARAVPGVRDLHVRVAAGDRVARRDGSGQDVGWIDADGPDPEAVAASLRAAHAALGLALEAP